MKDYSSATAPTFGPPHRRYFAPVRARKAPAVPKPSFLTLDQVLAFTHTYAAEIRQDAKARRVYRTFFAMTNNQFEALLAFSIWKARGAAIRLE